MDWNLDKAHSSIDFAVKHMGLATVRGSFRDFDIDFDADANGVPTRFEVDVDTASLTTGEPRRDDHLRSADFFATARYPKLRFVSTRIEALGGSRYRVTGDLDMHGQIHPATFEFELASPITDLSGLRRVAAEATGKLNRKQWGLTWNKVLEAGAMLVGEEVRFTVAVEASAPLPQEKEVVGAA